MKRWIFGFLFVLAVSFLVFLPAHAQDSNLDETTEARDWAMILREATLYLNSDEKTPARTQGHLSLLEQVLARAGEVKTRAQRQLQQSEKLLKAIGPPPGTDGLPEAKETGNIREQHNREIKAARARIAEADWAIVRVGELKESISRIRYERLLEEMYRRTPIPVAPGVLINGVPEIAATVRRILRSPFDWFKNLPRETSVHSILLQGGVVLILGALVGWGIRRSVLGIFDQDPKILEPSYARRFGVAITGGVGNSVAPVAALTALYFWVTRPGTSVSGLFGEALTSFLLAMMFFCLVVSFARCFLSIDQPAWRFTGQSSENANSACRLIFILAAVCSGDMFFSNIENKGVISAEAIAISFAVFGALGGWSLFRLAGGKLWIAETAQDSESAREGHKYRAIRSTARALAVIGIAALFVGYGVFGKRLITNLIWTGLVLWIVVLLRGVIHELVSSPTKFGFIQDKFHISARMIESFNVWVRIILDLVVSLCGIFVIVSFWGVPLNDLIHRTLEILSGFQVGSVRISIIDIFLAIAVFFITMAGARILQRQLSERFLEQTNLPPGIRHSLNAGFGYAGVTVAALLSISVTGIDLSNLALVVSALSVGIGFGLQNVVNNFISGLILLVERPIKVGDWVRVGSDEGVVKRIQFRATELQTWQRASVIIPNAEIISTSVTNLTHRDQYGRVEIGVGVAYGSDVEKVREILLDVADRNGQVSELPAPTVVFRDFGGSSLDFELRCFTPNVMSRLHVASDLRFEIDRCFREEGIEIPFPQRVVHLMNPEESEPEAEE